MRGMLLSLRTSIDNGPGQNSRKIGLGVTLVMALLVIFMPSKVAGQDQGGAERTPVRDVDANADVNEGADADLENTGLVPGRPTVRPTRTDTPPYIDGRLDDEVWKTAALITEFVQQSPLDGAPATEETEVYIAYDANNLYFAFYAHYEDPSIMRASRVDRDRASSDDLMTVYFDTFMDQQRGYDFDVNAYGVQGDGVISAGGFGGRGGGRGGRGGGGGGSGGRIPYADRSWNALFETGAQIVEDGYTAEMAIPFKSLRYPSRAREEAHRWGFQIVREVKDKDRENQVWAPMSRDLSSFFAQMGVLDGMVNLSTSRNIEVLPTFTTIRYGGIDPTIPAFVHLDTNPDAGVNVKYGITSNLTADFTVNPDFSQIESDRTQIEVNQRFPIFYPELRPFFVEGAEIFNFTGPVTLVHTRTMVDPDYGAKLTGKVGSLSLGVLAANDRAPGKVEDELDRAFGRRANTFISRIRYDLYSESNIGAIFTDREFLDGYSRLFGVDSNFRLNRTTSVGGRALRTWLQDPGGVERTGHLLDANIRQSGRNLSWFLAAYQLSPDFGTDVGFVRRTDERRFFSNISYRFWPEGKIINWGPRVMISRNWDFNGVLQDRGLGLGLNFSFAGNLSFSADVNRDMERFLGDLDGNGIEEQLFFTGNLRRTNRAMFVKLQYLLRY